MLAKGCQRWMYICLYMYIWKYIYMSIYIYVAYFMRPTGPLTCCLLKMIQVVKLMGFRWSWWRKPPGTYIPPWNRWVEPCEQETRKSYIQHVGVSKNRGKTPQNRWFIIENPIQHGWFGGTPIFGNTHIRNYHWQFKEPKNAFFQTHDWHL